MQNLNISNTEQYFMLLLQLEGVWNSESGAARSELLEKCKAERLRFRKSHHGKDLGHFMPDAARVEALIDQDAKSHPIVNHPP